MRKVISLSGLLAGLIAAPGFAGPGASKAIGEEFAERPSSQSALLLPTRGLTEEDRRRLQSALLEKIEHGPHDIGGMMLLQQQLAAEMHSHLQGVLLAEGPKPPGNLEGVQGGFDLGPRDTGRVVADQPPVFLQIQGQPTLTQFQRTEKATFLGVTTSRPDATLADQLQLAKGMGLVVDFIAKDSPAEAAGLLRHDVLTKLDDQLLINMEQLAVLVRSKKPGDTITLTAIRAGKPIELKAKLVEHDAPVSLMPGNFTGSIEFSDSAEYTGTGARLIINQPGKISANADGSTTMTLEANGDHVAFTTDKMGKTTAVINNKDGKELYTGPLISPDDTTKITPEVAAILKDIHIEAAPQILGQATSSTTIVKRSDANQNLTITIVDGHAKLVITDAKTGKEIYTGPADSDDDFKKMPDGVAEKVHAMLTKIPSAK